MSQKNPPKLEETFRQLLKSISPKDEPKMFQCAHCGGFHSFDINCKGCGGTNKAQRATSLGTPDRMLAVACCEKCLAVSVAIFKCHGIDPKKKDLQRQYAENAKAQSVPEKDSNVLEFKKK